MGPPMTRVRSSKLRYHHGGRRTLIDAAPRLVAEEPGWGFSPREVARRACVSHSAPYDHFPEKHDLLVAIAAVRFERHLRDGLTSSIVGVNSAEAMPAASGKAYVRLGTENPALYRLMFSHALARSYGGIQPRLTGMPAAGAKAELDHMIVQTFAIFPESKHDIALARLAAWSAVHGLVMPIVDRHAECDVSTDDIVERLVAIQFEGLWTLLAPRQPRSRIQPDHPAALRS
jgi:AcrR family transcriptional regulator